MYSISLAFTVVAPVILLLAIGNALTRTQLINEEFVRTASKLAYNVTLPVLLFVAISQAQLVTLFNVPMMLSGVLGTLLMFVLLLGSTALMGYAHFQRGVIIQAGFRANMGIVGLALSASLLGDKGIALASVYLGVLVPLFNLLAVWVLLLFSNTVISQKSILLQVLKSPLVIAVLIALPISLFNVQIPQVLLRTGELLGQVTLPLALLCIGASIKFRGLADRLGTLSFIVVAKCLVYPALVLLLAWLFGVQGDALIVLILLCLAPTATASFPAVQQLGGDSALAADAVALTTVLSLPLYMLVIAIM